MPAKSKTPTYLLETEAVLKKTRRRGIRVGHPKDTYRCARLANVEVAISDLESTGHSPVRGEDARRLSPRVTELVQLIHHIDKKVFGRPNPQDCDYRYSRGFAAYYAGEAIETAVREMKNLVVSRFALDNPAQDVFELSVFLVEYHGEHYDLTGLDRTHRSLIWNKDRRVPQRVGKTLKDEPVVTGLRVPSARHVDENGVGQPNVVAFSRGSLSPVEVVGEVLYSYQTSVGNVRRWSRPKFVAR